MNAREARARLLELEKQFSEHGAEHMKPYCEALRFADNIIALHSETPPTGTGQYRRMYLPNDSLMPYEHLELVDSLDEELRRSAKRTGEGPSRHLTTNKERICLRTALLVYRSALLEVHEERIKQKLRAVAGALIGDDREVRNSGDHVESGGGNDRA